MAGVAGSTALLPRRAEADAAGVKATARDGYAILVDLTRCVGCRSCVAACAEAKDAQLVSQCAPFISAIEDDANKSGALIRLVLAQQDIPVEGTSKRSLWGGAAKQESQIYWPDCWRVQLDVELATGGETFMTGTHEYWYSSGFGLVHFDIHETDTSEGRWSRESGYWFPLGMGPSGDRLPVNPRPRRFAAPPAAAGGARVLRRSRVSRPSHAS